MHIVNCIQGSKEWIDLRLSYDTASEAPAALGQSKYTSRSDLLKQKATGLSEEVGNAKQRLFDRGHESEAQARPLAEAIIGSDLYPVTAVLEIEGLKLLASLDGATMDEEIISEHKLWNESLAADVRNGTLAPHYTIQMDQQLLVSGAKKCLFMVSDGAGEKMVWCWYESSQEKFDALIAGWKQVHADLDGYVLPAATVAQPVGRTPETLPALHIEVTGMVTASNLAQFKDHALGVFKGINRELTTDQDFADAEKTVKWCGDIEERLAAAKQHALSQTTSIDQLFKAIDDIAAEARRTRLELDKLVKARKEAVRDEIVMEARKAFTTHLEGLNARLGKPYMPTITADFAGVIKGKRSIDSIRDAVSTELARVKISSNEVADMIQLNLATMRDLASEVKALFPDTATLVLKPNDMVTLTVKQRIADHKAAIEAEAEKARERIAQQEREKAISIAQADEARRAEQQRQFDIQERNEIARLANLNKTVVMEAPAPTPNVVTMQPRPTVAPATPPSLALGEISSRLGFNVTSAFLASLGFEATTVRAAKLYHERDFRFICAALINHINTVQASQAA